MIKGGRYLVLGDSTSYYNVTSGTDFVDGTNLYCHRLAGWIRDNYSPVEIIHKGVSGWTTTDLTTQGNFRWALNVGEVDLVTIGIGVNDVYKSISTSTIQTNLQNVINRLKKSNPNVLIFLCSPATVGATNPNGNMTDTSLAPVRSMYDTLASSNTNVFVCHFENAWTTAQTGTYTYDGLHPNATGHGALFNLLQPIVQTNASSWLNSLGK